MANLAHQLDYIWNQLTPQQLALLGGVSLFRWFEARSWAHLAAVHMKGHGRSFCFLPGCPRSRWQGHRSLLLRALLPCLVLELYLQNSTKTGPGLSKTSRTPAPGWHCWDTDSRTEQWPDSWTFLWETVIVGLLGAQPVRSSNKYLTSYVL